MPSITTLFLATALLFTSCATVDPEQTPMHHRHHTIDYVELAVTDLDVARRFYGSAFGWTFNDYGPEYAGIQNPDGGEVGGLRLESSVTRGGPLLVIYSNHLEASVLAVREAGGVIVTPPFAFPGGRRFHFTDPAGNELAVYTTDADDAAGC